MRVQLSFCTPLKLWKVKINEQLIFFLPFVIYVTQLYNLFSSTPFFCCTKKGEKKIFEDSRGQTIKVKTVEVQEKVGGGSKGKRPGVG